MATSAETTIILELKSLNSKICKISNSDAIEELLEELLASLKKQDELTQIKFCEDGIVTGYVIKVWDEETNTFGQDIYLDSLGATSSTPPSGNICSGQDVCDDKNSVGTLLDWSVIKD